jgi:hypothetical protein
MKKKETKKTFTFSARPSIMKAAKLRAKKGMESVSEVIEGFLARYSQTEPWKEVATGKPVKTFSDEVWEQIKGKMKDRQTHS